MRVVEPELYITIMEVSTKFCVSDDGWQRHQLDLPLGEHQQPEPGHLGLGGQGGGQQGPGRHWQSGHDRGGGGGGEEEAQPRKQGFILQQQRRFCHLFRGQICHFLSHFLRFCPLSCAFLARTLRA